MGTFYRLKIETQKATGEVIKFYTFDNALFSVTNKKYKMALLAAKLSGAPIIVGSIDRMCNGFPVNICYFVRENTALSAIPVSDNPQSKVSGA